MDAQLETQKLHKIVSMTKADLREKTMEEEKSIWIDFVILSPVFHVPRLYLSMPATCRFDPASLSSLKAPAGTPQSGQSWLSPAATCQGSKQDLGH